MNEQITQALDADVIDAKLRELELQRNIAFTRCTELAGINAALARALTDTQNALHAQERQMGELKAAFDAMRGEFDRAVDPLAPGGQDPSGAPEAPVKH